MVGHAKSENQKRHKHRKDVSSQLQRAVEAYREQKANNPLARLSIRDVADKFDVDHTTLGRHLNPDHRTMDKFNATKMKLSPEQEEVVSQWAIILADRNLALTSSLIHEQATLVYRSTTPGGILGVSWTPRFLDRREELSRHWSRPLDKVRAMSATPGAMKQYFETYKSLVGEHGELIPPHRQFAYDECGVQRGHGQRSRVVSSRHNKAAKINKGGSRELITFIPIISASGKLVSSVVVFPGKLLRKPWIENNPGNYS